MTKSEIGKAALGVALIIPCAFAGKFLGAAVGTVAGGVLAFNVADTSAQWVAKKVTAYKARRTLN